MKLAANIFKAYDIRGIYGKELTLDAIGLIAKSISNLYPNDNDTIVIGRDGRNSSSEISKALIDSFLKNGKNVIDIGEVPTPLLYFAVNHLSHQYLFMRLLPLLLKSSSPKIIITSNCHLNNDLFNHWSGV